MARQYPVVGAGLRAQHFTHLLQRPPTRMDWFEAISENYMNTEGRPMQVLQTVRRDYPVALHGVSMSLGSPDGIDLAYLRRLRSLVERIEPFLVSDHLCFSRYGHYYLHDLIPFPLTGDALDTVCRNVDAVQNFLGRRLALENASVYIAYPSSEMNEAEFLRRVVERTGAGVLLDLNNLYVNQRNVGNDPAGYFEEIPGDAILQMHLAGYSDPGSFYFDTHSAPVHPPVWDLFKTAMRLYPLVPVCIEWDEDVPEFSVLEEEVERARSLRRSVLAEDRDYVGLLSMQSTPYADLLWPERPEPGLAPCLIDLSEGTVSREPRSITDGVWKSEFGRAQKGFWQLFLSGAASEGEVPPLPVRFLPAGELGAGDALLVYAGGYLARREEAVFENYRATAWLLGSRQFYEIVHRYLADHFSFEYDLNRYGRDFWMFLREHAGNDPLLVMAASMARLDRAFVDVFHRAAPSPLPDSALEGLQARGDVSLLLNPSLEIVQLEPAVYDLWKNRSVEPPLESPMGDCDPAWLATGEILALFRRGDNVAIVPLRAWQRALLEKLKTADGSLEAALTVLDTHIQANVAMQEDSPTADEVREFFTRMARNGILSGVQTMDRESADGSA